MNTPYTYLIGWSKHDTWYYGVRFAADCSPDDLWQSYFTSSNYVSEFREQNGEPDVIQVRKTFDDSQKARDWESKVIDRIGMVGNENWLNRGNGGNKFLNLGGYILPERSEEHCKKISERKKGVSVFTEEEKQRRSKNYSGEGDPNYGNKYTREQKINILKGQGKYRKFKIEGVVYELVSDASDAIGMSASKIKGRLNSKLLKWEEWRYLDDTREYKPHGTTGRKRPDLSLFNKTKHPNLKAGV